MNVYAALKQQNVRLTNGEKWIVWNDETNEWEIYEHHYRKSGGTLLNASDSLDELLPMLLRDK